MTHPVSVPVERSPRILVVDPCPIARRSLAKRLRAMHPKWLVVCVETGCAALELLARHRVDVLIAELGLPDLRGPELIGLALSFEHAPACVVHAAQDAEAQRVSDVVHRVLRKPADDAVLFHAVTSALAAGRRAA
jgi:CheY-like chemotaxis protein